MIETSNPEIDVNELMDRVRVEAAKIAKYPPRPSANPQSTGAMLPRVRVLAPPPPAVSIRPVESKKDRLEQLLTRAGERNGAPRWVPKPLRWLFRRQGAYNQLVLETLGSLVKTNELLAKRVRELSKAVEAQNRWLHVLAEHQDSGNEWMRAAEASIENARRGVDHLNSESSYVKGELSYQQLMLRRLSGERNNDGPEPERAGTVTVGSSAALDAFYVNFEDHFRGSRESIRERVGVYLPYLRDCGAGTSDRPILDLGCGRGEWLELLRDEGLAARGADLNARMVTQCQERGLEVTLADALAHLRSLPDASVGAVTGFHIIEHLPLQTLVDLCAESRRVLQPRGLVLFESPNCKNLVGGGCNFYTDPTHLKPVFPDTAGFMLGTQGFERIEIRCLAPAEGSPFDRSDAAQAELDNWFYGPRDFAVIGYKPKA